MTEDKNLRVRVISGNGKEDLGLGYMVGWVNVYFWRSPGGSLLSSSENAEGKPSDELVKEMYDAGADLQEMHNPKIVLDNGKIIYGCQCYWRKVEEKA